MPPSTRKRSEPKSSRPHMRGYGLPKSRKGLLPWNWARQRLEKSHNYWISTANSDGSPHTMVVWGLWIDEAFYFSTGKNSRKARNLSGNAKCVVCTEHANEAVIVQGEAKLVHDSPQLRFFSRYEKKYKWDMSTMQEEPVYQVKPRVVFGLFEKKFIEAATRWTFPG